MLGLTTYKGVVLMKYGERFKLFRDRANMSQEDVARALKVKHDRGSSVSNIERLAFAPALASTVTRHAAALGCEPWQLLAGVATRFDQLRARTPLSDEEWSALAWGLALLTGQPRRLALEGIQSFVERLPPGEAPPQALQRTPALPSKDSRISRRKKRA